MPSTPEAGSRDVSAASDECRQNAIKNRKESDWFGHDAGSRPATSGGGLDNRPRSAAPRTPNKTARESEDWFRYDANGSAPTSGARPDVTLTKTRVLHGNQQDWYKHGDDIPDPPSLEKPSKVRSRRSACAEVRQKTTDPNEWFRHDHKEGSGANPEGSARPAKKPANVASPTSLWVVYPTEGGSLSPSELASTQRPHSRLTGPEADDYYRRDKIGSSAEWFSHDHPRDETWGHATRMRGTPEGSEIANRLKGESEDWFSHDKNQNYVSPLPAGKGHSSQVRELMERAQGMEMKQIFRMEENLRTTWNAPPPLFGPEVVLQAPVASAADPVRSDEVEKVRKTMDNLMSNGQNNGTTAH